MKLTQETIDKSMLQNLSVCRRLRVGNLFIYELNVHKTVTFDQSSGILTVQDRNGKTETLGKVMTGDINPILILQELLQSLVITINSTNLLESWKQTWTEELVATWD
jgi:hypothetical protein